MCLVYRHKSLLGVDQARNKKLRERIRGAIPWNNLKEGWSLQGKAIIRVFCLVWIFMNKSDEDAGTCHKLAKCSAYTCYALNRWQVRRWPYYSVDDVYMDIITAFLSGWKVNFSQFIGYPVRCFYYSVSINSFIGVIITKLATIVILSIVSLLNLGSNFWVIKHFKKH